MSLWMCGCVLVCAWCVLRMLGALSVRSQRDRGYEHGVRVRALRVRAGGGSVWLDGLSGTLAHGTLRELHCTAPPHTSTHAQRGRPPRYWVAWVVAEPAAVSYNPGRASPLEVARPGRWLLPPFLLLARFRLGAVDVCRRRCEALRQARVEIAVAVEAAPTTADRSGRRQRSRG